MTIFDVAKVKQELVEARRRAEALVLGLTPEQLTTQPEAGKWSIAECILHLNVTASVMQPFMKKAISQGKHDNRAGNGPFKIGAKGRLLIWIAEPPPKFKMPCSTASSSCVLHRLSSQTPAGFSKSAG
jgi:hypothetical protein